jgi:SAM-dependent methyltransferase
VRAEAPYLLEWIAYHRVLGVHNFYLGDNGGDDGTTELLQKLHRSGIVVRADWLGQKYFHLAFLRQAIEYASPHAGGLFLIDVDEFLRPTDGATSIVDLAQSWIADDSIGAVAINWALYGSSGHGDAGQGLVIERFTRRAVQDFSVNKHVKSFVRPDRCAGPSGTPHAVTLHRGRYVDTSGEEVRWDQAVAQSGISASVVWNRIRIDHFVLKSRAEFERKQLRGSAASPVTEEHRSNANYFGQHDRNEVDDPVRESLVRQTKSEIERLRAILERNDAPVQYPLNSEYRIGTLGTAMQDVQQSASATKAQRLKRVLNAGAGPQNARPVHSMFASERWQEIRIDIDPSAKPDVVGSITDMRAAFPPQSFDAIWSSHILEHLFAHQVPDALLEFRRVLRPDGFALITTPDLEAIASLILDHGVEKIAYTSPAGPITGLDLLFGHNASIARGAIHMAHKSGFTCASLGQRLIDAGFATVLAARNGFNLWAVAVMQEADQAMIQKQLVDAGLNVFQDSG